MPARKKPSSRKSSSPLNKDLFVFVVILVVVAAIAYVVMYNGLMSKFEQLSDASASQNLLPSGN